MNVASMRTMGYNTHEFHALSGVVCTAGTAESGTDEVYQAGVEIDRQSLQGLFLSGKVIINALVAGLGGEDTAQITVKIEDAAAEGGDYENAVEYDLTVFDANGEFVLSQNVNLAQFRRWIRVSAKCAFGATTTDTVRIAAILQVGGHDELPVTATPAEEES